MNTRNSGALLLGWGVDLLERLSANNIVRGINQRSVKNIIPALISQIPENRIGNTVSNALNPAANALVQLGTISRRH